MRPKGSAKELEVRRRIAAKLLQEGKGIREVARLVGAAPASVHRWKLLVEEGGMEALQPKPPPVRPRRVAPEQMEALREILLRGPRAEGFATDLWTLSRVAEVIERHFQVEYHPGHVWYILREMGWSSQKPERRARERDEEAVERWRKEEWPRVKKRVARKVCPSC